MLGEADGCGFVGHDLGFDDEGVVGCDPVTNRHVERTRIAFFARGTAVAQLHARGRVSRREGSDGPNALIETDRTAVEMMRRSIQGKRHRPAVDSKLSPQNAPGDPTHEGTEIHGSVRPVVVELIESQNDVGRRAIRIRHVQRLHDSAQTENGQRHPAAVLDRPSLDGAAILKVAEWTWTDNAWWGHWESVAQKPRDRLLAPREKPFILCTMYENLKLGPDYEGMLFLAESVRNPPALRPHRHRELEINLVVSGTVTYVVDGQRWRFEKGSLLWFYPSQEHQLVDRTADAQYYVAVFKPEMIRQACRHPRYAGLKRRTAAQDGVLHLRLDAEAFDLIRRTMDALIVEGMDPDVLNREAGFGWRSSFRFKHNDPDALNAGLRHLMLMCWRSHHQGTLRGQSTALHPAVRRALDAMTREVTEEKVGTLAQRCGVSASYLSRIFCAQVGVPINRYRNSIRLGRFWEAMHGPTRKTVTEAVYEAGFGSYAQFYKVFVAAYGQSPRQSLRLTRGEE